MGAPVFAAAARRAAAPGLVGAREHVREAGGPGSHRGLAVPKEAAVREARFGGWGGPFGPRLRARTGVERGPPPPQPREALEQPRAEGDRPHGNEVRGDAGLAASHLKLVQVPVCAPRRGLVVAHSEASKDKTHARALPTHACATGAAHAFSLRAAVALTVVPRLCEEQHVPDTHRGAADNK